MMTTSISIKAIEKNPRKIKKERYYKKNRKNHFKNILYISHDFNIFTFLPNRQTNGQNIYRIDAHL